MVDFANADRIAVLVHGFHPAREWDARPLLARPLGQALGIAAPDCDR